MPKRHLVIIFALLLALAAGGSWYGLRPSRQPALPAPVADEGGAPLHPLMIEAIRSRDYPASALTLEREVANQGSYSSYVISYRSDSYKVYALMNRPNGAKPAAGWPVLIFNHGYIPPAAYQTTGGDYRYWLDGLSRAGYLVIKPDFRGHGQSEGPIAGGHWAPDYTYDVLNLISSLKRYDQADAQRIGMLGHSMGAHVTLRAIVTSRDIKASAMLAGVVGSAEDLFYNWRRTTWRPPSGLIPTRQQLVEQYGEPKDNPDFWGRVSAINYVKYVAGPVQLQHGTNDESVPKVFSDNLQHALLEAKRPVEYFIYEGGDHQFSSTSGTALSRLLAHFGRYLR